MNSKQDYTELSDYIIENQQKFYRIAYSYMQNEADALDMVSEAIVSAYESYAKLRNPDGIKTWFYRILVNKCVDSLRRKKREVFGKEEEILEIPFIEKAYDSMKETMLNTVRRLPEKYRVVIILKFYENCTFEEIAKITNVNVNTVKSRLYAALERLKQQPELKGEFADG